MTKYPLLESVVIIYIIMLSDIAVVRNSAFFYFAPENDFFLFPFSTHAANTQSQNFFTASTHSSPL